MVAVTCWRHAEPVNLEHLVIRIKASEPVTS